MTLSQLALSDGKLHLFSSTWVFFLSSFADIAVETLCHLWRLLGFEICGSTFVTHSRIFTDMRIPVSNLLRLYRVLKGELFVCFSFHMASVVFENFYIQNQFINCMDALRCKSLTENRKLKLRKPRPKTENWNTDRNYFAYHWYHSMVQTYAVLPLPLWHGSLLYSI